MSSKNSPQDSLSPPALFKSPMAWLDHNHNESPFHEMGEGDKHEVAQLLVLVFRAYFSPVVFVHGFFGNMLSLITLCRIQHRAPGRFNLYAIAITISFLFLLIFDTLLDDFFGRGLGWLTRYRVNLKLDQISSFSCKLITYVTDTCGFMATAILAIFAVDRVRTLCYPLHFRADRHIRWTTVVILSTAVISIVLFCPTLVFYDVITSKSTNKTSCTLTNPSNPGATYTLLFYALGTYTLPTLVILVCNFLIGYQLARIKRKQKKCGLDVSCRRDVRRIIGHLAINTTFLLLMIPLVVVILMRYDSNVRMDYYSQRYRNRLVHLSRFFSSLLSVYYSSTFWVFFLFLPTFRDSVLELFLACPMIARSLCGPCLYRHMTYGGARRFRAKSMIPSLMYLAPLQARTLSLQACERLGLNLNGSLPPPNLAIMLVNPKRSLSKPEIEKI